MSAEGWYYRSPPPEGWRRKTPEEIAADQARALNVWRSTTSIASAPDGKKYLLGEGLKPDVALYPDSGDGWPETVAWAVDVFMRPTPPTGPGLVFAINDANTGLVCAIQRIPFGRNGLPLRDADGKVKKLGLGPTVGNAFRGSCWPDPQGRWGIAEGIKNALAATQLVRFPVWGAVAAGNMETILPPSWARHVTIFADDDSDKIGKGKDVGIKAAARALAKFRAMPQIESSRVLMAPRAGWDAADVLKEGYYA